MLKMKFMAVVRSAEGAGMPPLALMEGIANLGVEATKAGVLVETGGLLPSADGALVRVRDGGLVVTDGPFTEAREVIGGYAVYNVSSKAEVLEWTRRFMELHRLHWPGWEGESEVRQIMDAPPPDA
jgi:hypothetical protein